MTVISKQDTRKNVTAIEYYFSMIYEISEKSNLGISEKEREALLIVLDRLKGHIDIMKL